MCVLSQRCEVIARVSLTTITRFIDQELASGIPCFFVFVFYVSGVTSQITVFGSLLWIRDRVLFLLTRFLFVLISFSLYFVFFSISFLKYRCFERGRYLFILYVSHVLYLNVASFFLWHSSSRFRSCVRTNKVVTNAWVICCDKDTPLALSHTIHAKTHISLAGRKRSIF